VDRRRLAPPGISFEEKKVTATHTSKSGTQYPLVDRVPQGLQRIDDWHSVSPGIKPVAFLDAPRRPLYPVDATYNWVSINNVGKTPGATRLIERALRREETRRRLADTTPGCTYKTLTQAYADGWSEYKSNLYGGERLRLRGHDLIRGYQIAHSRTEWKRRCREVVDTCPHGYVHYGYYGWYIWREDQTMQQEQWLVYEAQQAEERRRGNEAWYLPRAAQEDEELAARLARDNDPRFYSCGL
jgi:hypothetical protein